MSEQIPDLAKELAELREAFKERLAGRRAAIDAAIAAIGDAAEEPEMVAALEAIEKTAHDISGSGGLFGFADLGSAAEKLESAARTAKAEQGSDASLEAVTAAWRRFESIAETV